MNSEDIIRMARKVWSAGEVYVGPSELSLTQFAALVAAASDEKWKQAVISELMCCHIYNAAHENDPRKALHDAISWNVQVALDPQVSSDAQALINRGAAAEREEILAFASSEAFNRQHGERSPYAHELAAAIRARGQK